MCPGAALFPEGFEDTVPARGAEPLHFTTRNLVWERESAGCPGEGGGEPMPLQGKLSVASGILFFPAALSVFWGVLSSQEQQILE